MNSKKLFAFKSLTGCLLGILIGMAHPAFGVCGAGEQALKSGARDEAVKAFNLCAINQNDEDAQLWLARFYQNKQNPETKDTMKTLLFYHLAAENGNANAQVALAKILLKMDESDTSRNTLSSYLTQMKAIMESKNMTFKGEMLHPYVLLTLAAENADQKWYYPTVQKTNTEAQLLLQNYNVPDEKKRELRYLGSLWKQRKMMETAQEVLSIQEYEAFKNTVFPSEGTADAFARQMAVSNLKDKVEQYLKQ